MSVSQTKKEGLRVVEARPPQRDAMPAKAVSSIIAEFQSDAVELEERAPPNVARLTLYGVTALLAGAVLWASVSTIDEIVVAPGRLITTEPTIVVQPLETSIIRTIDVAVGEIVQKGQTLATLDATFSESDMVQRRAKFAALDAQVRRIESELAGADYTLVAGNSPDEKLQVQLFGQRRKFYAAQLQNFDQQVAGQAAAIASGQEQATILIDRQTTLTKIEKARETLYKHQTGSLLNLLASRDSRLGVDADLSQLNGRTAEAEHTLAKLRAERQAFIEDFRRETMEQLVGLRGERDTVAEDLKKMELRRNMVALTAPADAVVLDLAQRSIGSVVREAEPIVTLVPMNVPLEAEVSVNALDIARLSVGGAVRLKFDAYPFQKFGTASGKVRTISQDAYTSETKETKGVSALPYFKARVALTKERELESTKPIRLLPGMAVTAEMNVGRRSVISYFLYPLIRGLDASIREP
jgi:hemolysin D